MTVLEETRQRLAAQGVGLQVSDAAVTWLGARGAGGPKLGARPLRRTVAREVDRRLSRMLLAGEVRAGGEVRVDVDRAVGGAGGLTFEVGGDGRG